MEGVESDSEIVSSENRWHDRIHVRPFDETFDVGRRYGLVLMLDVLEHLQNPEAALRHALRLLEPAGRIVISVPAFNVLWTSHDRVQPSPDTLHARDLRPPCRFSRSEN